MVEGRYAEGVKKGVSDAVSAHSSCRDDDTIDCFTSVSSRPTLVIGSAISITVKNMVQFIFDTCSRDSFTYVMIEIRGTNSTINTLHPCRIHVNPPLRLSSIQDQRPLAFTTTLQESSENDEEDGQRPIYTSWGRGAYY